MTTWLRRILVVDDDPLVRSLLAKVLTDHGFLVETCADASEARDLARQFDPDLAILDVNLGSGPTGVQLGYVLERVHPEIALLYLTRYPMALLADSGMSEHLQDQIILSKDDVHDASVVLRAIEDALRGDQCVGSIPLTTDEDFHKLTRTQIEVLRLLAQGMTNAAIAEARQTSERAVEKQVKAIYTTLGFESSHEQNARVLAARRFTEVMGAE
jgi:DNA-binding NarL/FixJ family response regulator